MQWHKSTSVSIIIGSKSLLGITNLKETVNYEVFDGVSFDLWTVIQGKIMEAKYRNASINLIISLGIFHSPR